MGVIEFNYFFLFSLFGLFFHFSHVGQFFHVEKRVKKHAKKKTTEKVSRIFFPIYFFQEITGKHIFSRIYLTICTHSIERSAPGHDITLKIFETWQIIVCMFEKFLDLTSTTQN